MPEKVWLITGTSSGFGRDIAEYALEKGQKVIATARGDAKQRLAKLAEKGAAVASLDVTASQAELGQIIDGLVKEHGRIDVLVNNAGMVQIGTVEETTDEEWKRQFDVNLFGLIRLTSAVLPHMRSQKSGTIVNIGSRAGRAGFTNLASYSATKFALEAVTENLNQELVDYNIKAVCVEPGDFRTDVFTSGSYRPPSNRMENVYRSDLNVDFVNDVHGTQRGSSRKGAEVIVDMVLQTAKPLPIRLALGPDAVETMREVGEAQLKTVKEWEKESSSTDHDDVKS